MIPQAAFDAQIAETSKDAAACCWSVVEEARAGSETILLVEDETFVRDVASEVLRSAGYQVLTAKDATEAGAIYDLHGGEVDLLVTDVVLPGESGRAFAQRLQEASSRLQVLLITGYAKQMGLEGAGTVACLAKPFSVGALLGKVRECLIGRE